MTSYCSIGYLCIFLPVIIMMYKLTPQVHRWRVLLIASYAFYWYFSQKLIIFLLLSTVSIYLIGKKLSNLQDEYKRKIINLTKDEKKQIKLKYNNKKKRVMFFSVILHIGILVIIKYTSFFLNNINSILEQLNLIYRFEVPQFILPLGISFYTLQALSYLIDIYRGKIKADQNIGRLALFLSFFPQIMEGPICRYEETAMQLMQGNDITYKSLTFGLQRILFGVMKKVVVADRLNLFIKTVFKDFEMYDGGVIAVAMICYTCQLYMEFSGTMDIVVGSGEIFRVKMPENFRQPFFSRTISDFWARWHITLGTWFRDYIFYPLSMSKPLKKMTLKYRKILGHYYGPMISGTIALFAVWISNGLWHGAAWNYIFFGMYHFILLFLGNLLEPVYAYLFKKIHVNRNCQLYKFAQIIKTVIFVNIGELFFRAHGLKAGLAMFYKMITDFRFDTISDGKIFEIAMDQYDFIIVFIAVLIVFVFSILKERHIDIRQTISQYHIVLRWSIYLSFIMFIVIFGAYGTGYIPIDPIYVNF